VLSELRSATGLDDLDIVTEDDGATALRAGKYVSDNIYLDVQTDSEGVSQAGAVLELTDQITARGSVGSDGNSIFGLFFERDF
jgi:translocation and assembly module TamB